MKKYWLTLNQDTFLWVNTTEGCVYNSRNGEVSCFRNEGQLSAFVDELMDASSLYRTVVNDEDLSLPDVKNWAEALVAMGSAQLIEDNGVNNRPVSLKPELKMQDTVSYYEFKHEEGTDGGIMTNLHKLIVHINGSKYGDGKYAKQFAFPLPESVSLDEKAFFSFLETAGNFSFLSEIVLVGCPWKYAGCNDLLDYLKQRGTLFTINCTEHDFIENINKTNRMNDECSFRIKVSDYAKLDRDSLQCLFQDRNESIIYDFIVTSEEDYDVVEQLIERYQLSGNVIIPVFTGTNHSFFRENIYITEDDFKELHLSKRDIFAHQTLNTHFFGTLTVFPDGKVFADTALPAIGTMDESLYSIVYREMTEGSSWFRIRDGKPCCDCVFQYLCPSPSGYEQAIGKQNLCHIKP